MFGPDDNDITLNDSCDSLGTRRLPPPDGRSVENGDGRQTSGRGRSSETVPDALSDVSFFVDSDDDDDDDDDGGGGGEFQCTLAIIKPEAARLMYKIESVMERNGFIIKTKDVLRLTREQAAELYSEHAPELYFARLTEHMSSGPVVVYALAKKNCVDEWRRLIGPADVSFARRYYPVSLRAVYGTELGTAPVANAFHGSDSPAAANREIRFFFPDNEIEETDDVSRYVQSEMMPTITEGLSEMFKVNPSDPLRWFGNWLLTKIR